ncbi:MAG: hypothetical protein D6723_11170, partial [Acidobacteria bacterium]
MGNIIPSTEDCKRFLDIQGINGGLEAVIVRARPIMARNATILGDQLPGPPEKVASLQLLAGEFMGMREGSGFRSSPRLHSTPDAPQLDCGEGSDERLVWKGLPPFRRPRAAGPRGASLRQLFQRPALNLQEHRRLIDGKAHV